MPAEIQVKVPVASRRRCRMCFGLFRNTSLRIGQLAHLDRDSCKAAEDNLAFPCLDHPEQYDRVSRQSKGFQPDEVKLYRTELYSMMRKPAAEEDGKNPYSGAGVFFRRAYARAVR